MGLQFVISFHFQDSCIMKEYHILIFRNSHLGRLISRNIYLSSGELGGRSIYFQTETVGYHLVRELLVNQEMTSFRMIS